MSHNQNVTKPEVGAQISKEWLLRIAMTSLMTPADTC